MINLMRSGYPQGEALTLALAEAEITWASGRTGDGARQERSPEAPRAKRQRNRARDGGQPATSFASTIRIAPGRSYTSDGKQSVRPLVFKVGPSFVT